MANTNNQSAGNSLYQLIGKDKISDIIEEFYGLAFHDPMICHFFFGFSQEKLTKQQIKFTTMMLGGPKEYQGKPLKEAHKKFKIRKAHFGRRQVILEQVMDKHGLDKTLKQAWLGLEANLKPLIVQGSCA